MREAIIKTLCYSAVFNFPLTIAELQQRLIGQKASIQQVSRAVKQLNIASEDGFFYLNRRHLNHRKTIQHITPRKIADAHKIARLLQLIPTIQAIYITGSVSVGNATSSDDIDIMIITRPNALWTTRFIVNSLLDLLGVRRKPSEAHVNNKICLNLWLTTQTLTIPSTARSLYTAYEVFQARPIFNRHQTHEAFLFQNRWINTYLPNVNIPRAAAQPAQPSGAGFIETLFFRMQRYLMKSKMTREKISLNQAFFHPRDTGMMIDQAYHKLLKKHL